MPLTFPPAQKAVPAAVISSTPTSGFSPQVLIMVRSAGVSVSDIALRTSGRFSVMMATRSRITHNNSSVPVSILVSVVILRPMPVCLLLSELLDPRPQFQFPGPGATRLLQHVPVAQRNGVGIEHRIRPLGRLGARRAADAAIDHEMRDVNALRRQLARHALGQAAQCELTHREGGRLRV